MTSAHLIGPSLPGDLAPEASRKSAVTLIEQKVEYSQGVRALTFYFVRKIVAMNQGHIGKSARQMQISQRSGAMQDMLRLRPMQMSPEAMREAELWATRLALEGTSHRDAQRIFRRGLMDAGLSIYVSKTEVARRLRVSISTVKEHGRQQEMQYRRAS
jgi:hypothetical protein